MKIIKPLTLLIFSITIMLIVFIIAIKEVRLWQTDSNLMVNDVVSEKMNSRLPSNDDIFRNRETAITSAIRIATPGVVGITATTVKYKQSPLFSDPFWRFLMPNMPHMYEQKAQSLGSGFIQDPTGYVITNAHVVEDATEISIILEGGEQHAATLIGIDQKTDLAVLKIDANHEFPFIETTNSDEVMVGEWTIALGNPFGLFSETQKAIATAGIVSSLHMDFGIQKSGQLYTDMIQTDASINSGNSGGPLLNSRGEVMGINTFIFTGGNQSTGSIGIGFAIPINFAIEIINELKENGFVDRSFATGLAVQNLDAQLAQTLGVEYNYGVLVVDVVKDSEADKAGVEVGDIIIGLDSKRVKSDLDIFNYIRAQDLRKGDSIVMNIWRNGVRLNKSVNLGG
jgi:serine protease Do